jgi:hypothetical protein
MGEAVERAIARLAGRQHRNVSRAQVLALGLDDNAIHHRVRIGRWHRTHAGVYTIGPPPRTPHERAAAAVLACGPDALLSHASALSLWGLAKSWTFPCEVTTPGRRRPARLRVHQCTTLTRSDRGRHFGIPVTTPARTLLDMAPRLDDKQLALAVSEARHKRILYPAELAEMIARNPRHPGAKRLRKLLGKGILRSGLEFDFVAFCERYGLPEPETNEKVVGHVVDALFRPQRVVVEIDSIEYHFTREAFETDRDRDADLVAAGYAIVRITEDRLQERADHEAERLRDILEGRAAA